MTFPHIHGFYGLSFDDATMLDALCVGGDNYGQVVHHKCFNDVLRFGYILIATVLTYS